MNIKNFIRMALLCVMSFAGMSACAGNAGKAAESAESPAAEQSEATEAPSKNDKVLVAYFSRTGDNYAVGNIKEGNTAIIAKMIAEETGGDLFEIEPMVAYPDDYTRCTEVAKEQLNDNVRPDIKGDADVEAYDVIYIGYPVWWGEAPMPVYTFIDKHEWKGKTVIPFCTHEGSGLSGTKRLVKACAGASEKQGLAIKGTVAQNNREDACKMVKNWLGE